MTLTSPIDGVVRELRGHVGDVVDSQQEPIATLLGEGAPRVEARFLREPPAGATLRFDAVDGASWPLVPTPRARVVEADDGVLVMWFDVADERRAYAGLRGVVVARPGDDAELVQVPTDAILRREEGPAVARRRGDVIALVDVELVTDSGASAFVRARDAGALVVGDLVAGDARAHARRAGEEAG